MNQQNDLERKQLLAIIEQAFRDVRLEDGVSMNMAEYKDSGGSEPRYLELAKSDERDDWRQLSDSVVEEHDVTLSFTDLKGLRFYLPAYMGYSLRSNDRPDGCSPSLSCGSPIEAVDPDHYGYEKVPIEQWFTAEQLSAIMRFLEYCIKHDGYLDSELAKTNLKKIKERLQRRERESRLGAECSDCG